MLVEGGLATGLLERHHDVAEMGRLRWRQHEIGAVLVGQRKRQHVGDLVDATVLAVQLPNPAVRHDGERDLVVALEPLAPERPARDLAHQLEVAVRGRAGLVDQLDADVQVGHAQLRSSAVGCGTTGAVAGAGVLG